MKKTIAISAAAVALSALFVFAQENAGKLPPLFAQYKSSILDHGMAALPLKSGGEARLTAKLSLKDMANKYLLTDKTFTTASGTKVNVSLTQAYDIKGDKERGFYFTFKTPSAVYFANAFEIAHLPVVKEGGKALLFDKSGDYNARFDLNSLSPMENKLVVEKDGAQVFSASMNDLAAAIRKAGESVHLGKTYSVFLVNKVVRDSKGAPGLGSDRMFVFVDESFHSTVIPLSAVSSEKTSFAFESDYSFAVRNGCLEIYR